MSANVCIMSCCLLRTASSIFLLVLSSHCTAQQRSDMAQQHDQFAEDFPEKCKSELYALDAKGVHGIKRKTTQILPAPTPDGLQ